MSKELMNIIGGVVQVVLWILAVVQSYRGDDLGAAVSMLMVIALILGERRA